MEPWRDHRLIVQQHTRLPNPSNGRRRRNGGGHECTRTAVGRHCLVRGTGGGASHGPERVPRLAGWDHRFIRRSAKSGPHELNESTTRKGSVGSRLQGLGENNSCREVSARPGGNFSNNMCIREIQKNRQYYMMCRSEIAGTV
jgi:hypothetical protein